MRIAWHRVLLAFAIAGLSLGSLFLSGGMCGGSGSGHYESSGGLAAR